MAPCVGGCGQWAVLQLGLPASTPTPTLVSQRRSGLR